MEDNVCKVPLIGGYQSSLNIGDPVFSMKTLVTTRCGFGVLGEVISPIGDYLAPSESSYSELELTHLFKTH